MSTPRHQKPTNLDAFLFGAPYYPEHWSPDDRKHDAPRMSAAGVNVVRLAEFAWDRIEPARGQFDFALFDDVIDQLHHVGIRTILCTPTATPPRWLTDRRDDWFRVDAAGRRMDHGSRQHCCTNNEDFRAESRRITAAMADHYKHHPAVIGWQTDNELYCHFSECYCPACVAGFRSWLAGRYESIDALNAAWGNAFWALTYDRFDQIPLPRPEGRPAYTNPSHLLDYCRYLRESIRQFQAEQVAILRAADNRWWITHNGTFDHVDYWQFAEDLDFVGVDVYPGFANPQPDRAPWAAWKNQSARCASGGYIVPEQQAGAGGQQPYLHKAVPPGQMRLWAWQAVAHGADGVLHFRWRTCRFGAEMYWNGIIDHDNIPRRRYQEFAREGAELERVGPRLLHTTLDVRAAVLVEIDQDDAHNTMHNNLPGPGQIAPLAYEHLWRQHLPCGAVDARDDFAGLKLIVVPSMPMIDDDLAGRLRAFVEAGGTLLVTARSFVRDRNNHVLAETPPGRVSDWMNVTCEEFGRVGAGELAFPLGDVKAPAGPAYEILQPQGAEVLATWNRRLDGAPSAATGQPAMTVATLGAGKAYYLGTFLTPDNTPAVLNAVLAGADIPPLAEAEPLVEVTRRRHDSGAFTFVLNHYPRPAGVDGLPAGTDLLTGAPSTGSLMLEPFGLAVIEESTSP